MNESIVAAIVGALGLGTLLPLIVQRLLNRGEHRQEELTAFRGELREEIRVLRVEADQFRREVNEWQQKYFAVSAELVAARAELQRVLEDLEELRGVLKRRGLHLRGDGPADEKDGES